MDPIIDIEIMGEYGYLEALYGLGLSRNLTDCYSFAEFKEGAPANLMARLHRRATKLAPRGKGHNKFLETMAVNLRIRAARYFWHQVATYRVGTSTQSQSTMYTITRRPLEQDDFARPIPDKQLRDLNELVNVQAFDELKNQLPEGYLQVRALATNYQTVARMMAQRQNHRLPEWSALYTYLKSNLEHPEFLPG